MEELLHFAGSPRTLQQHLQMMAWEFCDDFRHPHLTPACEFVMETFEEEGIMPGLPWNLPWKPFGICKKE